MSKISVFSSTDISNTKKSIDHVVDAFLSLKKSENTKRAYARDINSFIEDIGLEHLEDLGEIQFERVVSSIQQYLDSYKKVDEDTGRVINAKTINRKAYSLSSFFKYLIDVYGYPRNPLNQYHAHKVDRRSTTESLTRSELIDLLKESKKNHRKSQTAFRNYIALCVLSILALRRQELVGLKWSDLRSDTSSINVYQKGGSYKLLPIPTALYKHLMDYRSIYPSNNEYIFHPVRNYSTGVLNKPLNVSYVYEFITKLVKKVCPEKNITPHSLRKTFIEQALNNNEDFISIINATGHSTVEMVKYYDTRDTLKNNAVHNMGKLV